ncbi:cobalamin biosynthesis protein, partial [Paracidovorax avenae]
CKPAVYPLPRRGRAAAPPDTHRAAALAARAVAWCLPLALAALWALEWLRVGLHVALGGVLR